MQHDATSFSAPAGGAALGEPMAVRLSSDIARHMLPLQMNVSNGRVHANGQPFAIKGIEWHGTEQEAMVPLGLEYHSLDYYLAFLQKHNFNSIRLPFDHDRVLRNAIMIDSPNVKLAPELVNLPYVHIFLTIARAAARRGLTVVLAADRLSVTTGPGKPGSGLWYSEHINEELVERSWSRIANILCSQWNVVGVDLMAQVISRHLPPSRKLSHLFAPSRTVSHVCRRPPVGLIYRPDGAALPRWLGRIRPDDGLELGGRAAGQPRAQPVPALARLYRGRWRAAGCGRPEPRGRRVLG